MKKNHLNFPYLISLTEGNRLNKLKTLLPLFLNLGLEHRVFYCV